MSIPLNAFTHINKLVASGLDASSIATCLRNRSFLQHSDQKYHKKPRNLELLSYLRQILPPVLLQNEPTLHIELEKFIQDHQCLRSLAGNPTEQILVSHENDRQLYFSEDENENNVSFTSVASSEDQIYQEGENTYDSIKTNSWASSQRTTVQNPKLNQNDAIKIISTNFTAHWEHMRKTGFQDIVFPPFHSYQAIEDIISKPKFDYFLVNLVSFLEKEINKYENDQGVFRQLEKRGYLDSKIDRILQTLNDLISLNNLNPKKPQIMRFLDRSFLKFDDRSERKTKKSIYAKEFPMEEEKSEVKPKKKEGQDKILPASNQNDALKLFSSYFQDWCSEQFPKENFPKFKFFKDITDTILKDQNFPIFMKNYTTFLNLEIVKSNNNSLGMFSDLKAKGYFENTLNRIILMWQHLIIINNHIDECDKCHGFFNKNREILRLEDWNKFGLGYSKKNQKTVFEGWVNSIEIGDCRGFNPFREDAFKLAPSSRGIKKKKKI